MARAQRHSSVGEAATFPSITPVISIAVAGSAGAGRSTLALNLAHALTQRKRRVALFSALAAPEALFDVALLDLPPGLQERELSEATEVLAVLRATDDPAGLEAALLRLRPAWRRTPARFVVNQFDAREAVQRAGLRSLRARLGARLLEPSVQFETAGPIFPAGSQAAADVLALSRVLVPVRRRDAR